MIHLAWTLWSLVRTQRTESFIHENQNHGSFELQIITAYIHRNTNTHETSIRRLAQPHRNGHNSQNGSRFFPSHIVRYKCECSQCHIWTPLFKSHFVLQQKNVLKAQRIIQFKSNMRKNIFIAVCSFLSTSSLVVRMFIIRIWSMMDLRLNRRNKSSWIFSQKNLLAICLTWWTQTLFLAPALAFMNWIEIQEIQFKIYCYKLGYKHHSQKGGDEVGTRQNHNATEANILWSIFWDKPKSDHHHDLRSLWTSIKFK